MKHWKKLFGVLMGITACSISGLYYAHEIEPEQLKVRKEKMIPGKHQMKKTIKVVFFSDTHFGSFYAPEKIKQLSDVINRQEPDLVFFGGDLINCYHKDKPDIDLISNGLAQIQASYGKFAVYGNHDYGSGARFVYKSIMEKGGFELLKNDTRTLRDAKICISGLDDMQFGKPDWSIRQKYDEDYLHILLSHEPDIVDQLNLSTFDVVFSGHTHGGQVYVPGLRSLVLPYGGRNYPSGTYTVKNQARLYVSSGVGTTGMKLRFCNPPEILVVEFLKNKE